MPSLDECQNKIDVYTNAKEWLTRMINNLKEAKEYLEKSRNSIQGSFRVNGEEAKLVERIKNLEWRMSEMIRWNSTEIMSHMQNEINNGRIEYNNEQMRLDEENND